MIRNMKYKHNPKGLNKKVKMKNKLHLSADQLVIVIHSWKLI
jgi:hypothetical protein